VDFAKEIAAQEVGAAQASQYLPHALENRMTVSDPTKQDSRTFKELCAVWSGVTGHKPEILLEALVQAFWRGDFERDVRLIPTERGDQYHGHTAITAEVMPASASADPKAGNYALRMHDGVIVKIGKDGVSRPTADRAEHKVYRDSTARGPDIPDWDACLEPGAANRPVPEHVLQDFAKYTLGQWSQTAINHRYYCWRIARTDFAPWYARWHYAPLASLDQFWPAVTQKRKTWQPKPGKRLRRARLPWLGR
jgi:hypothetical protein